MIVDSFLRCLSLFLNFVPPFDGSNYGYWNSCMRIFLKSIKVWHIVESGWTTPDTAIAEWTILKKKTCVVNDRAMNAICLALSLSEFLRISHCETSQEAWEILETTYEGTKLVKFAKLQILVSQFERIGMLEYETFNEFYAKINDIRNSMINLGKRVSDAKLIKKVLWSLPERFMIKVTTIEESKDLDIMKIEELVGSLQTYEFSMPPLRKNKSIALKVSKEKFMILLMRNLLMMMVLPCLLEVLGRWSILVEENLGTRMLNLLKNLEVISKWTSQGKYEPDK